MAKRKGPFTTHSVKRLSSRTTLMREQLIAALDQHKAVKLGVDPGTVKVRYLIWSPKDLDWFVVLQDSLNGDIITVLPVEYHENLAYKISEAQKQTAKELFPTVDCLRYAHYDESKDPKCFVSAIHLVEGKQKSKLILREPRTMSFTAYLKQLSYVDVKLACAENDLDISTVLGVSVRDGQKGTPQFIALDELRRS